VTRTAAGRPPRRAGEGTMIYRFAPEPDGRRFRLTLTIVSGQPNGPVSGTYESMRE